MIGNPREPHGSTGDFGIPGPPKLESPLHCAPRLNERIRQAHSDLVQGFERAVDSHARSLFDACIQHLTAFDEQLRSYLGHEEAELEDYLNTRIAGDAQHLLTMRQVRAKLRQLARQVHEMLQPPHPSRANPARSASAVMTFRTMMQTLVRCVETSELELLPHCPADPAWSGTSPVSEGPIARTRGNEPVSMVSWRHRSKR